MSDRRWHRGQPVLKDWMPGFNEEVTALYREGNVAMAEDAERNGHMYAMPAPKTVGEWLISGLSFIQASMVTDSPIEARFAMALRDLSERQPFKGWVRLMDKSGISLADAQATMTDCVEPIAIFPQVWIAGKRVDFVILGRCKGGNVVTIIECDGHDYHSSKEQLRRDKARDRAFVEAGYRVLRFTGSEIHEDAEDCAGSVLRMVSRLIREGKAA